MIREEIVWKMIWDLVALARTVREKTDAYVNMKIELEGDTACLVEINEVGKGMDDFENLFIFPIYWQQEQENEHNYENARDVLLCILGDKGATARLVERDMGRLIKNRR